jgi:hypothetical protein
MEEEKRRKEKKEKLAMEKEGFPEGGPTLLAVQRFTAVRYN